MNERTKKCTSMYHVPGLDSLGPSTMSCSHFINLSLAFSPEADPETKELSTSSLFGRWSQEKPAVRWLGEIGKGAPGVTCLSIPLPQWVTGI